MPIKAPHSCDEMEGVELNWVSVNSGTYTSETPGVIVGDLPW